MTDEEKEIKADNKAFDEMLKRFEGAIEEIFDNFDKPKQKKKASLEDEADF